MGMIDLSIRSESIYILTGDLLLFRPRPWTPGWLIARAGRSEYYHAGMAAWWGRDLMCLDTTGLAGGRAVLLSNLVRRYPGRIDVYSAGANQCQHHENGKLFDRHKAARIMIKTTGMLFGRSSIVGVAFLHLFVLRLFTRPNVNDIANGSLPFCSQAVAHAYRVSGADPVPNLANAHTEPGDLGRSRFFRFLGTLWP